MVQFFQTIMGKRFFEGQLPELIRAINKLAENLAQFQGLQSHSLSGQVDKPRNCKDAEGGTESKSHSLCLRTSAEIENFLQTYKGEIRGLYNDKYYKNGGWNGLMDALTEVEKNHNVTMEMDADGDFEEIVNRIINLP